MCRKVVGFLGIVDGEVDVDVDVVDGCFVCGGRRATCISSRRCTYFVVLVFEKVEGGGGGVV